MSVYMTRRGRGEELPPLTGQSSFVFIVHTAESLAQHLSEQAGPAGLPYAGLLLDLLPRPEHTDRGH